MDNLGVLNALVGLFVEAEEGEGKREYQLLDYTEVISDEQNPNFETKFILNHKVSNTVAPAQHALGSNSLSLPTPPTPTAYTLCNHPSPPPPHQLI